MQVIVIGSGLTRCFQFNETINVNQLKLKLEELDGIPAEELRLICNSKDLIGDTLINEDCIIRASLKLLGGKGGFGSLLRAGPQGGIRIKKTTNFDACRDLTTGKRIRHVNNEKFLKEWQEGEDGRELEKVAEKYLNTQEKEPEEQFDHERYTAETNEITEEVGSAVEVGLKVVESRGKTLREDKKRKIEESSKLTPSSKKSRLWTVFDDIEEPAENDTKQRKKRKSKAKAAVQEAQIVTN